MKEIPLPRYVKRRETHSLENPRIRIRNLEANQTAKGLSVISDSELSLFCRGPEFGSQHSCGGLQPLVTQFWGTQYLLLASVNTRNTKCTYVHTGKTLIHMKVNKPLIFFNSVINHRHCVRNVLKKNSFDFRRQSSRWQIERGMMRRDKIKTLSLLTGFFMASGQSQMQKEAFSLYPLFSKNLDRQRETL